MNTDTASTAQFQKYRSFTLFSSYAKDGCKGERAVSFSVVCLSRFLRFLFFVVQGVSMLADEIIDYWDTHGPPGKVGFCFERARVRMRAVSSSTLLSSQPCSEMIGETNALHAAEKGMNRASCEVCGFATVS